MNDKEELVPIERVLDDMYNEDKVSQTVACVIMGLYAISVIAGIVIGFIQG